MRTLAVLVLAGLLAGCTAPQGLRFAGSDGEAREPYYKEWRTFVDGSHLQLYDVPIEPGARSLQISLVLSPRTNGMPLPDLVLARLDLSLSDPQGALLEEASVDVGQRAAHLQVEAPPGGTYVVQVEGVGTSREVDGTRYGDAYTLVVEVLYA